MSREQAIGLPLLALIASFVIVLGVGRFATAEEQPAKPATPTGPAPPSSAPAATPAAPPAGFRLSVSFPPRPGDPAAGNPGTTVPQPGSAVTATPPPIRLCVRPHEGWRPKDPGAAGWVVSANGSEVCRDVRPEDAPLDLTMEVQR